MSKFGIRHVHVTCSSLLTNLVPRVRPDRVLSHSRVLLMFVLNSMTKTNLLVIFFCEYSVLLFIVLGMKRSWDRTEIIRCQCNELSYPHVHCPCSFCKGKPVSSSVEYRHWQQQAAIDTELDGSTSSLNQ